MAANDAITAPAPVGGLQEQSLTASAEASAPATAHQGPRHLVVGVGASASGLEAFKELLEAIPADCGLTFLFVQHLDPSRPSLLREILAHVTPLTVKVAEHGARLEPNQVLVMPPDTHMSVRDGHVTLGPRSGRAPNMPADILFRSLAENLHERAVGVILSGGGTDGTLGFQAIKAEGGVTFAQDEKTAKHDGMPRSAVGDGNVDYVLPPPEIGRQLLRLAAHPYATHAEEAVSREDAALAGVLNFIRGSTGIDFATYKRGTIGRRIRRRMALRSLMSLEEYLTVLTAEPAEARALYQDLLIRVTRFFRDEDVFGALKEHVFPALVRSRSANTPLRIGVAGCSTGEEVYSLAIELLEFLGDRHVNYPIKILATDINDQALEKARAGVYLDNIEIDVSPDRACTRTWRRRSAASVAGRYRSSPARSAAAASGSWKTPP